MIVSRGNLSVFLGKKLLFFNGNCWKCRVQVNSFLGYSTHREYFADLNLLIINICAMEFFVLNSKVTSFVIFYNKIKNFIPSFSFIERIKFLIPSRKSNWSKIFSFIKKIYANLYRKFRLNAHFIFVLTIPQFFNRISNLIFGKLI